MPWVGYDKDGKKVAFERIDIHRFLYEIVVDFFGNRGQRRPTDGLEEVHYEFIKAAGKLLSYSYQLGRGAGRHERNEEVDRVLRTLAQENDKRILERKESVSRQCRAILKRWDNAGEDTGSD